mgnify:FL=1
MKVKSDHRSKFSNLSNYELNKLTSLPMCGFSAQLVEHRTSIAEVTGSDPVEALVLFGLFPWKIYCDDRSSLPLILKIAGRE